MIIRVICIRSRRTNRTVNSGGEYKRLIVGNVYDVEVVTENSYMVNGWWENKDDFMSLSEHRDKQLESIGI